MKRAAKWVLSAVGLLGLAVAALFLATKGNAPVAALVTDDSTLPSQQVAGLSLHMRIVEGPPDGQTLVVLHGGAGGDHRSLLGLSELSDTHSVVFYDQRGAGLSERVDPALLSLDGYLEELDAVIAQTSHDQPAVLIGHSWGAMLASAYMGAYPDRVDRAVLIEPGYLDAAGQVEWETASRQFMSGASYWSEAVLNGFRAAHVAGPDDSAQDDFLIGRMVGVFANHPDNPYHCGEGYTAPGWRFGAVASALWRDAPKRDLERIATGRSFKGPVLFLAGACNSWTGEPLQARHAAAFSNAALKVVPEAGHDVVWDNPDAALAIIRGFLAKDRSPGE